jgi:hypothetical protein
MIRTLARLAVAALAVAALAAPTAVARPDAPPRHAVPSEFPPRPVLDRPSAPASSQPAAAPATPAGRHADHGVDWAAIGLGLAGGLLVTGSAVAIATRTRPTAPEV